MYKTVFHERLTIAMRSRGIKQADLVNKTNISKSQISEYCSGKCRPKQDKLYLIAKELRVNPVWLMGFDVEMDSEEISIKRKIINSINMMTDDELQKLNIIIDTMFSGGDKS